MLVFRALLRFVSIGALVLYLFACMGGCLGCDTKPKLISAADDPLKGQNSQVWKASKTSRSESFFTTRTCEMDNSNASLDGCVSLTHDALGASTSAKPSEFVNHGFLLWNQSRQKWTGNKRPESRSQQLLEPKLSWNATYDSLLSSNKPFRKPIPLGEMVDFLVDIWEQEGMYD
ncbi:uncharacterized protein [Primulina huaijiensis]|uniref:uncharacterized protein isoform X1 n=2 Tax=Primulina huaijiensis TaxID=1492673 RepID=UPI003CC78875